jgi:hypothetical protein
VTDEVERLIDRIEDAGCPHRIIIELKKWNHYEEHTIGYEDLERWCKSAGILDTKKIKKIAQAGTR